MAVCRMKLYLRAVVKEVVSQVVADVSKDASAKDCSSSKPVVCENSVGKLPEGKCKDDEKSGRHH